MDIKYLESLLEQLNQPRFRLEQIRKAIYHNGASSFLEISSLPQALREELNKEIKILSFDVVKVLAANDRKSAKALLKLKDSNFMETVLISPKPGFWSVCVSSQVGCPLGCAFCATGQGGFKRNLTAEEIVDQVLFWRQYIKNNFKFKTLNLKFNVVYMGMGEPFLNWSEVKESLKMLTDKDLFGFGARSISVSTAGIAEGIISLAKEFPQVNLAVSLHFAQDEKRSKFMPINKKYNLKDIQAAFQKYFSITNRKVFLEYIMLDHINDQKKDADDLIRYVNLIDSKKLLHVNLIPTNASSTTLKPSSLNSIKKFKRYLLREGINVTIRKSLGGSIAGACGQLAGKNMV